MQWTIRRQRPTPLDLSEGSVRAEVERLRKELRDLKSSLALIDQVFEGDPRLVSLLQDASTLGTGGLLPQSIPVLQAQLQAKIAVMQLQSSERTSRQLKRASWALVGATVGLVVATAVLIVVTAASR